VGAPAGGKTWVMQQILHRLQKKKKFDVLKINLKSLKIEKIPRYLRNNCQGIGEGLGKTFTGIDSQVKFQKIFKKEVLKNPLF